MKCVLIVPIISIFYAYGLLALAAYNVYDDNSATEEQQKREYFYDLLLISIAIVLSVFSILILILYEVEDLCMRQRKYNVIDAPANQKQQSKKVAFIEASPPQ